MKVDGSTKVYLVQGNMAHLLYFAIKVKLGLWMT